MVELFSKCSNGHTRTIENTYQYKNRQRACRLCRNDSARRWRINNRDKIALTAAQSYDKFFFGGNRERAIIRDSERCTMCSMTRQNHHKVYGVDITVDHIDGNGRNNKAGTKNNNLENLQTLCMRCHGIKDGIRSRKQSRSRAGNRSKSGILGIAYVEKTGRWRTFAYVYEKRTYIGTYGTKEQAIIARDNAYRPVPELANKEIK